MQVHSAIVISLVCFMIGMAAAGRCGVSAPEISLSELNSGCFHSNFNRRPVCVSAMHRFCEMVSFPTVGIATLGVSREAFGGSIGMSCVRAQLTISVNISTLQQFHSGCDSMSNSQTIACLAATHRYCMDYFKSPEPAGISQEVINENHLLVQCFKPTLKEHVDIGTLNALHGSCSLSRSALGACFSAASRWCVRQHGYSGGVTQEVDEQGITVACYNDEFSNDAVVTRNYSQFDTLRSSVSLICNGVDFNVDHGTIVTEAPQFLKTEIYDNRASSVPLQSVFSISKEFAETNFFERNNSLTIRSGLLVTVKLPFFNGNNIAVATSFTSSVSLTEQNVIPTSYSADLPVQVPAGQGIVKQATIKRAVLDVPWTASIVNGLGAASTIGGQWLGVSTYDFQVTQSDIVPLL